MFFSVFSDGQSTSTGSGGNGGDETTSSGSSGSSSSGGGGDSHVAISWNYCSNFACVHYCYHSS